MKKFVIRKTSGIISVIVSGVLLGAFAVPGAFADDQLNPDDQEVPTIEAPTVDDAIERGIEPMDAIDSETKIDVLKAKGAQIIKVRVDAMTRLKTKIQKGSLTDAQKTSLISSIDSKISALTALNVKIQAETVLATVKTEVKSIYTDYRIFAVFLRQMNLLKTLNAELNTVDKVLNEYFPKVQAKIDAAKAKGKDTTARQAALDAAKLQLPTIKAKINELIAQDLALTPADYPKVSRSTLNAIKKGVRDVHQMFADLNKSMHDGHGKDLEKNKAGADDKGGGKKKGGDQN